MLYYSAAFKTNSFFLFCWTSCARWRKWRQILRMKVSIYVHIKQGLLLSALTVYFYSEIFLGGTLLKCKFSFLFFLFYFIFFGTGTICLLSTNYYFYDSVIDILKKKWDIRHPIELNRLFLKSHDSLVGR